MINLIHMIANTLIKRTAGILILALIIHFNIDAQEIAKNIVLCDYEGNTAINNVYNNINLPGDITVSNPYKTGINTSAKCSKLTVTANWNEVGFLNFKMSVDLSQYGGVAYKIYSESSSPTTHLKIVKNANTNWWENPANTMLDITSSRVPAVKQWVADTIQFFSSGNGLTYGVVLQPWLSRLYSHDDVFLTGKKPI